MSQRNPKAPDFKHKIDNTALWIDSKYTPTWVKDRLEDFNIERQGVYAFVNNFNLFYSRWFHIKKLSHVSFEMENSNIGISIHIALRFILKRMKVSTFLKEDKKKKVHQCVSKRTKSTTLRELIMTIMMTFIYYTRSQPK